MLQQFEAWSLQACRVPAIDPSILSQVHAVSPADVPDISPKEWCCCISHLKAIWTAWSAGDQHALILEDDISIIRWPDFPAFWSSLPREEDYHVLQLLAFGDKAIELMRDESSPVWVRWTPGIWSTGAYMINKRGARHILAKYAPQLLTTQTWPTHLELDFTTMRAGDPRARVVSDWCLYVAGDAWTCTDVFFTETGDDSTIKPQELSLHAATIRCIKEVARRAVFKMCLPAESLQEHAFGRQLSHMGDGDTEGVAGGTQR